MPLHRRFAPGRHDYIIVGAGSAGCALAARLSEDPGTRVLLLEAGPPDRNPWLHIPVGYYRSMVNPALGWGYATEPVPEAGGREINMPRGRVLGGSSAINGLIYTRGQREDFDHWRQLGNAGWSYDDVLPYFRRAQRQARGESEFHGAGGGLGVSDVAPDPLCEAYIEAAVQAGYPHNDDFNGASQEGVGYYQLTTWKGLRSSSARAYLANARSRPNLDIVTDALTTGVILDGTRAVGVRFSQAGELHEAHSQAEVILCGGAINSPQLLMLSGIGPADHLRDNGIEALVDLPGVGQNFQDHYQVRVQYECTRSITVNDEVRSWPAKARAGLRWALRRDGPLAIGAGHVGVFARTNERVATPDVQIHFIRFSADNPKDGLHPFPGFTVSICQLRPESRGAVTLRSADPTAKPRIQPNYLATETDRQTMVDAVHLARHISAQPAMTPMIKREIAPGSGVQGDAALLDFVRQTGITIYHPTSSCMMGPGDNAVVDERLRVKGVEGLRVADASIMPAVVSANTNATCIMIGEKAADLVREGA